MKLLYCFFCLAKSKKLCECIKIKRAKLFKPWQKMNPDDFKYLTFDGETAKFNWIIENYKNVSIYKNDTTISLQIMSQFYSNDKFNKSGGIIKFCKIQGEELSKICKLNIKEGIYGDGQKFMWNIIYIDHELSEMQKINTNVDYDIENLKEMLA